MRQQGTSGSAHVVPPLIAVGAGAVIVVWVGDSALRAFLHGEPGGLLAQLLTPNAPAIASRVLAIALVLASIAYTRRLLKHHEHTERELAHERMKLGLVYDHSPDAILVVDPDFHVRYANSRVADIFGVEPEAVIGALCHTALQGSDDPCDGCRVRYVLRTEATAVAVRRRVRPDGDDQWLEQTWYPIPGESGSAESVAAVTRDISEIKRAEFSLQEYSERLEDRVRERTAELEQANRDLKAEVAERKNAEKLLRESEERFRRLVELSPDLILVHIEGVIAFINPQGARMLGYDGPEDLLGGHVMELVHPDDHELAASRIRRTTLEREAVGATEVRMKRVDGSLMHVEIAATPLTYHGRPAVQAVAHDISARKEAEETIRHMAYYDILTGLPNRALFDDRLAVAIHRAEREEATFAVMFMDLDDFKAVNDTLGHTAGDELLAEVAHRLVDCVRKSDTVARLGGDEFTILLPQTPSPEAVELVARKILDVMAEPAATSRGAIDIDLSIGIAFYPECGRSFSELMHAADMAMYAAKTEGRRFSFAEPTGTARVEG